MDHHTIAAVSISGTCLDVLGSLYLAYDLLGGQHGPLRLITRAVTYSIVFGVGYGLGLGLFFGLASGIATGITISLEFNRAARGLDHYSLPWEAFFSGIRGFGFGAGLYPLVGFPFALAFAILISAGQTLAYSRGMRPAMEYVATRRPRVTRRQIWGTLQRTVGYIVTALLCSAFIHHVDHMGIRRPSGFAHGRRHRRLDDTLPLHRVLRRQSPRTPPRSVWHRAHALRICHAIPAVLAGLVRCQTHLTLLRTTQPAAAFISRNKSWRQAESRGILPARCRMCPSRFPSCHSS